MMYAAQQARQTPARIGNTADRRAEMIILFFFSPLISLFSAFRNHQAPWAKDVMWLFVVFFGFTFVVTGRMDSKRYSEKLIYMSKKNVESIPEFFGLIYEKESGYVDVLQPLVTFIISRFTDNSRVLFAFFGLIFGFFYSRNLWFLFSFVEGKIKREAIPFLLLAALVVAMWQINGFRFWTAAHVFVFGFLTFLKGERLKGIIFCLSSLFVHFSFALPMLLLLGYVLIGNRLVLLFALYFSSFFISQVSPQALKAYSTFVPEVFQERSDKYVSKEYLKVRVKESKVKVNWYVDGRIIALRYATNLLLIILFVKYRRKIAQNKIWAGLLCYSLLLASVTNLSKDVPSMGRFQIVADITLFSFFFLFVQNMPAPVFPRWAKIPFLAAATLYLVVEIRIGFETTSLLTVLGNPLVAPFLTNDFPLISFFK